MRMQIIDREIHHIAMGEQRFRCIEYHTESAVVLLSEHRELPKLPPNSPLVDVFAQPGPSEMNYFQGKVSEYMDGLLKAHLAGGKRCFTGFANWQPPRFVEYANADDGKVACKPIGQMTLEQLLEGIL